MATPPALPPAAGSAIEVANLECGYDGKVVLKNISFTVARGEIFFIIGGSGCGKSTLLRHMVGLHTPTAGTVKLRPPVFGFGAISDFSGVLFVTSE